LIIEHSGLDKRGAFLGVFDGHGGRNAVGFVVENIHKVVLFENHSVTVRLAFFLQVFLELLEASPSASIPDILAQTFQLTDKRMAEAQITFDGTHTFYSTESPSSSCSMFH
jgi:serine/threonine protein phosphatase PrpC